MAKEFMDEKGVEYTDYNVAEDSTKRDEMMQKSGAASVPFIVVTDEEGNEETQLGFDKDKLATALGIEA